MRFKIIFSLLGTLVILFIVVPLLSTMFSVNPGDLARAASQKEVLSSIFLTLRASFWATIAALLFGVPLAFQLARVKFFGKKVLEGIIDIPVLIPHTAAGIALLLVWGRDGVISKFSGLHVVGTEAGISIAMFFVSVPFLVNSAKEGFKLIDDRYEKTAISLGATRWEAFRTISLPMAKKSIISGTIMMWARGISEFGAVVVLAYHPMTAPVFIYERFQNYGLKYSTPVTVLLILITLLIFIVLRVLEDKK